jgi:hypothetical protein
MVTNGGIWGSTMPANQRTATATATQPMATPTAHMEPGSTVNAGNPEKTRVPGLGIVPLLC